MKKKIVIVEDNLIIQELHKHYVLNLGHEVVACFENGQDVIDFSHKIVLLLSGSIKNGLWNKNNDMLTGYTSLDRIEYIPKNNYQSDTSYNINYYDYSQKYQVETASDRLAAEFASRTSNQFYTIQPTELESEKQYSVKTEFVNQPPPGINQLFNYILY